MKILDYRIQTSFDAGEMEDIINNGLQLGYEPYGPLSIHYRVDAPPIFRQVTVKYEEFFNVVEGFDIDLKDFPHEHKPEHPQFSVMQKEDNDE